MFAAALKLGKMAEQILRPLCPDCPERTTVIEMTHSSWLDDLPLFLTVYEAGEVLRVGRSTAYELVRSGRLKSIRVGKQIRVPKTEIIKILNSK